MATILVADDERPLRELLGELFQDDGHRVLLAVHGRQALEHIAQEQPDLVLADVMMPLLGGVELCRHLKAETATRAIPVILMSTAAPAVADGAGADAFLRKPFRLEQVERLVAHWLAFADLSE